MVCAISENLARETCLACVDAGLPVELRITKQGNGNTYGETLACLEWLKPDEILLNEGRRTSQLAIKVLSLYNQRGDDGGNSVVAGGGNDEETPMGPSVHRDPDSHDSGGRGLGCTPVKHGRQASSPVTTSIRPGAPNYSDASAARKPSGTRA